MRVFSEFGQGWNYPKLNCLSALKTSIENRADKSLARMAPLHAHIPQSSSCIGSAWRQNKDASYLWWIMKCTLSETTLEDFGIARFVLDDLEVDQSHKRHLHGLDVKYECTVDMKRTFQFTMWKRSED